LKPSFNTSYSPGLHSWSIALAFGGTCPHMLKLVWAHVTETHQIVPSSPATLYYILYFDWLDTY